MEECESALSEFTFSQYKDHIHKGAAFGTVFYIADDGFFYVNIYDYQGTEFDSIKLPEPITPYNVRA